MSPGESLPVLQWNAGGLCQPKRVNFLEDYLLKQDASISQRSRNAIPFDNIKLLIKKKVKELRLKSIFRGELKQDLVE